MYTITDRIWTCPEPVIPYEWETHGDGRLARRDLYCKAIPNSVSNVQYNVAHILNRCHSSGRPTLNLGIKNNYQFEQKSTPNGRNAALKSYDRPCCSSHTTFEIDAHVVRSRGWGNSSLDASLHSSSHQAVAEPPELLFLPVRHLHEGQPSSANQKISNNTRG